MYRREKQTYKVDIFSLGCCIFYLLTGGHRPHEDLKQPENTFVLNANILTGRFDLIALAHLPEAGHMISHMIALQKESRPTVQWLLDWHCYFWSQRKRFEFLCAVGNEEDKKTVLPPSMCSRVLGRDNSSRGWRALVDDLVWDEYTRDSKYRQHYDCTSIAHLLRFMRNASQHTKPNSAASAVYESVGGMESYFLQRFPRLLLMVWAVVTKAGWGKRSEFEVYLPADVTASTATATASTEACEIGSAPPAASQHHQQQSALQTEQPVLITASSSTQQVADWLTSIGPTYAVYGAEFMHNGINGRELLNKDFGDDELVELRVGSTMHRKRILREIQRLKHDE